MERPGTDDFHAAANDLDAGADELHVGAGYLAAGANDSHVGAGDSRVGASDLHASANDSPAGGNDLYRSANDLDAGGNDLDADANDLDADASDLDAGANEFLAGFDALAQAVRRARGANGRGPDGGLTLSQYGLLEGLGNRRAARVQELAAAAGISASTATRILDALERRGIVRRTRSDEDRRAVSVSLTGLGEELLQAEQDWLRGRQRAFYASLPQAEQELAPDLLMRLAALIDALAAGPDA